MRVLVIEDDQVLCEMFETFLRQIGHEPRIVHTAEDALDLLQAERPDVLLLDLALPGMSGLDFLRRRAVRDLRITTLVISGRATEREAHECLELGAYDFIGKPVALPRLEEILGCFGPPAAPLPTTPRSPHEPRRAPRTPIALSVRVREGHGREWDATSVNVSTSGIKIRARGPITPGRAAILSLETPDGATRLELASVLVRTDPDGYAFYFPHLNDWQRRHLNQLVEQASSAPPKSLDAPLHILHTIGHAMSASLDVDEVLRIALDALTRVTGHEIASLHLLGPDGTTLELRGDHGLRPHLRDVNRVLPVGEGIIGRVAATGQTIHLEDASVAPDLLPAARAAVREAGIHALACVPIRSHGQILGVLSLGRRMAEPFTASDIALVEASAQQIGLALENAQLHAETRRQLDELRSAATKLIETEKLSAVGKLTAGLVHDVRNRLTAIHGQVELLLLGRDDPARSQERLHRIAKETSRAVGMLQNLVRFASGDAAERRPCRLENQVQWVLELTGSDLRRAGIEVVTDLADVPPVLADESQIQHVLLNLIQNAHQAMATHPRPRVLTVRLSGAQQRAVIDVCDTGPGIPPELLPRVFSAFTTTKPPGEGSGLGLWVSHAIVEQHRGSLRAENRPEGGAAFRVEFPYATTD